MNAFDAIEERIWRDFVYDGVKLINIKRIAAEAEVSVDKLREFLSSLKDQKRVDFRLEWFCEEGHPLMWTCGETIKDAVAAFPGTENLVCYDCPEEIQEEVSAHYQELWILTNEKSWFDPSRGLVGNAGGWEIKVFPGADDAICMVGRSLDLNPRFLALPKESARVLHKLLGRILEMSSC